MKFGQIGDVIMAIPAAHELHKQGYEIHWMCGRGVEALLGCYSWIHVLPVDEKTILFGRGWARLRAVCALWAGLLFKRYDLCATLYYDRRYRLLTLPVWVGRRVRLSRRSRSTTLIAGRHHADEYARVLLQEADDCRDTSVAPVRPEHLPACPLPRRRAARRIAIVPGGVNPLIREKATGRVPAQGLRCWAVERYVSLAKRLADRGWEIVLLGSAEDRWVRPHFAGIAHVDCLGTLTLPQVIGACDGCDAVVTHDTGPLHLAGLSGTCLVGVFGPTDPATRVPRREFAAGIWGGRGFACRPCYDGREFAPCGLNACMQQVTPEQVLRELDRLLVAKAEGRASPWRVVQAGES